MIPILIPLPAIIRYTNDMPTDKLLHLLAGIAIAAVAHPFGILWAGLAVFVAAIGKEAYDSTGRGYVEVLDAVATLAGGAVLLGWYSVQPVLIA